MVGLYRKTCEPKIGDENDQQWQSVTVPKKCNTGQNKDPKREQQHQRHQRRNLFSGDDAIGDNNDKRVGGRTNVASSYFQFAGSFVSTSAETSRKYPFCFRSPIFIPNQTKFR